MTTDRVSPLTARRQVASIVDMNDPADQLIRTADLRESGWSGRQIATAVARGVLVRIRRGVFVHGGLWASLDSRQQHVIRASAVVVDAAEPILTGRSAAAVWGIPVVGGWPDDVMLLARPLSGGKSEPGVRRTSVGFEGAPTELRSGLPVTTLARTVVDLAAREGFEAGVVAADWALAHGCSRAELQRAASSRSSARGAGAAHAAVAFADRRAESVGESCCRVAISRAGFVVPDLQVVFADDQGEMRVDFFWPEHRVVGEFDGKVKYTRDDLTGGDPSEVVWREKLREDRLRAIHPRHVRLVWPHVRDLALLSQVLTQAGIPRRRSVPLAPFATGAGGR